MSKLNAAPRGLLYKPGFVPARGRQALLDELAHFKPIWEQRYSKSNPPPPGQEQRWLLRPVYWLGNWQFACLNYYHPPKGLEWRCVQAEPYPPRWRSLVSQIENLVCEITPRQDLPSKWELNTCLVNYYGSRLENGKWVDVARVGEHKDFEPGPVTSISFGDRALFQFVESSGRNQSSRVVQQMWLEDSSLQVFFGDRFKKKLFHRVQRVEKKRGEVFPTNLNNYETRRLNLTFRYVPREHIQPLEKFPAHLKEDVKPWVSSLAQTSDFFAELYRKL